MDRSVTEWCTDRADARPAAELNRIAGQVAGKLPAETRLPLVSVVVTAYNYEAYVGKALESVVRQTYENLECIVVDDCSTDGTLAAMESFLFEHHDSRFRLVRNESNCGQLGAQIAGFRASRGAFTVFLDADDILFPDSVEANVAAHLQCEPIAAMTCMDSATISRDGELLSVHHREIRPGLWQWLRPAGYERTITILGESVECRIIPPAVANRIAITDQPYWTTQSFMMFRSDFLKLVLSERGERSRICADYYLYCMAHAFNTTILLNRCGGAYRIHGANQFTQSSLISADQQSGDLERFAWQVGELAALSGALIRERFDEFAAVFGELQTARALIGIPRRVRPPVFRLLFGRLRLKRALFIFTVAWTSRWTGKVRRSWRRFVRVVWSGV